MQKNYSVIVLLALVASIITMGEGCSDANDSPFPEKAASTKPRDLVMETPDSPPMSGANITFEMISQSPALFHL